MLPISFCYFCGKVITEDRFVCDECEHGRPEPSYDCVHFYDYLCDISGEECPGKCLYFKEDINYGNGEDF